MTREIILNMTRKDLITLLSYNDPNGTYNDKDSLQEFGNIMTRQEGIEIALQQFELN